jgi:uncharacterized protein involved in type VI secretion and phage assembly
LAIRGLGNGNGAQADGRRGILTTPLPKDGNSDPLALVRFDGSEGLSELFSFNVEAISPQSPNRLR